MSEPNTSPGAIVTPQRLLPWLIFAALLVAAVVGFFEYADRVPSLLQALADR